MLNNIFARPPSEISAKFIGNTSLDLLNYRHQIKEMLDKIRTITTVAIFLKEITL